MKDATIINCIDKMIFIYIIDICLNRNIY